MKTRSVTVVKQPIITAICNQKGGVGKTTVTFCLADSLSRNGKKGIVIDLDPQGNSTLSLHPKILPPSTGGTADVITRSVNVDIDQVLQPTIFPGVDLLPSVGDGLSIVNTELIGAGPGREARLAEKLKQAFPTHDWDYVLIDCQPDISQLTVNALTAADQALIVTNPLFYDFNGLVRLMGNIARIRQYTNSRLEVVGVLPNRVERRTNGAQHWLREPNRWADGQNLPVLLPEIPKRVALEEAIELRKPVADPQLRRMFNKHAARLMKEGNYVRI